MCNWFVFSENALYGNISHELYLTVCSIYMDSFSKPARRANGHFSLSYWKSFFVFLSTFFEEISKRKWHLDEINKPTLQSANLFNNSLSGTLHQSANNDQIAWENIFLAVPYLSKCKFWDNANMNKNRDEKLENCWLVLLTWGQHELSVYFKGQKSAQLKCIRKTAGEKKLLKTFKTNFRSVETVCKK